MAQIGRGKPARPRYRCREYVKEHWTVVLIRDRIDPATFGSRRPGLVIDAICCHASQPYSCPPSSSKLFSGANWAASGASRHLGLHLPCQGLRRGFRRAPPVTDVPTTSAVTLRPVAKNMDAKFEVLNTRIDDIAKDAAFLRSDVSTSREDISAYRRRPPA